MKLAISNIISSTASSDLAFTGGGRTRPLTVVRRANAKGMRLTVNPRDASVRLTLARRLPLKTGLDWVRERRAWVEAEMARLPPPCPIEPGMMLTIEGDAVRLDWAADRPRRVVLAGGVLSVGGPRDQLGGRVLRFLRARAQAVLEAETRALAADHGITVARVAVADARGRWGSCSSTGDIRYSWRLIMTPAFVRRAVVAHELAHRRHMDHSPAFYRLAREIGGIDQKVSRAWLRANGIELHWFGRTN